MQQAQEITANFVSHFTNFPTLLLLSSPCVMHCRRISWCASSGPVEDGQHVLLRPGNGLLDDSP